MGLADRHYMRGPSSGLSWSATTLLIASLVVAFLLQQSSPNQGFIHDYLALSLPQLQRGFVWELLTFQFLHGGWVHLLLNCWVIYIFGREVEWALGKARFLVLYLSSGVFGGLLQMLGAWLWPAHLGGAVVGASAGAFGLVAAFAMQNPSRQLMMMLFFVVPIQIRAMTLLILSVVLAALGIAFPASVFGGHVAHAAHFGGILAGVAWVRFGWSRDSGRLPWQGWFGNRYPWHPFKARQRKRELIKAASIRRLSQPSSQPEPAELPPEEFISREVDPILDKISEHGIQSLTERERRILEAARNRMAKR